LVAAIAAATTFSDARAAAGDGHDHDHVHGPMADAVDVERAPEFSSARELDRDTLTGLSGALRMRFIRPGASMEVAALSRLFGDSAVPTAGLKTMPLDGGETFAFVTLRPFRDKVGGRIGSYRIGNWPYERGTVRNLAYANPHGFIEVTKENQNTYVSRHFRLRDFLTKDQHDVWPKYLVLDERLIDKLELVIQDLQGRGYDVRRMAVMSGFRTPQYNARGVGAGGRASTSRHQYGDAADVFVDNNGNGRMDDLNGDGRVDLKDARIILESVDRVERRYPQLVGGAGLYRATSAHAGFVHVDARGSHARWGLN
jgi:uncharacterized protein YcbK (DUF882 family)